MYNKRPRLIPPLLTHRLISGLLLLQLVLHWNKFRPLIVSIMNLVFYISFPTRIHSKTTERALSEFRLYCPETTPEIVASFRKSRKLTPIHLPEKLRTWKKPQSSQANLRCAASCSANWGSKSLPRSTTGTSPDRSTRTSPFWMSIRMYLARVSAASSSLLAARSCTFLTGSEEPIRDHPLSLLLGVGTSISIRSSKLPSKYTKNLMNQLLSLLMCSQCRIGQPLYKVLRVYNIVSTTC